MLAVLFESVPNIMTVYIAYLGVGVLAWCALWAGPSVAAGLYVAYTFALLYIAAIAFEWFRDLGSLPEWTVFVIVPLFFTPMVACWIYASMKRLLLVPQWTLFFAPLLVMFVYAFLRQGFMSWDEEEFLMACLITAVAYLPFATTPLVLQWHRHR